jgi:hypothetical protein
MNQISIPEAADINTKSKKLKLTTLISETYNLFTGNLLKILQLYCLFALWIIFEAVISDHFFSDISAAFLKNNIYGLKNFSLTTLIIYIFYNYLVMVINMLVAMLSVIMIHNNHNLSQAFEDMVRKIIPLISTSFVFIFSIASVIGSLSLLLKFSSQQNFWPGTIIFGVMMVAWIIIFASRSFFYSYVVVFEDKYNFKALSRSAKYTKNNIWSIYGKLLVIALLAILGILVLYVICSLLNNIAEVIFNTKFNYIKDPFSLTSATFEQKITTTLIGFLPGQFMAIAGYIIYRFYRIDLPENFSISKKQKIFLLVCSIPIIFALLFLAIIKIIQ